MTIVHKKSSVSGKRPKSTDLVSGELAINTADGSIFLERDDGEVVSVNGPCSVTASAAASTDTTSYAHLASFECDTAYGDYNGIFALTLNSSTMRYSPTMRCSTIFSIYLRVNNRVNNILVNPTINIDIHSSTPNEYPTGPDDIYIAYNTPATTTDKCKFELWVKKTNTVAGKISLSKLSSSSNLSKTYFTEKFNNTPLSDASVTDPNRLDGVPWLPSLSSPLPNIIYSKLKDLSDSISPLYWNTSAQDANDIEPGQRVLCLNNRVLNVPYSGTLWYIESKKTYSSGSVLQIAYEYASAAATNLRFAIRHQRDSDGWSAWEIFDNSRVDALEASVADMKWRGIANTTTSKGLFDLNDAPVGSFISVRGEKLNSATYNWPVCENLSDNSSVWFNVITFGDSTTSSRLTQYATQVFSTGSPNNQNRTWYRSKHDSTWSPWEEVAFANPTSQSVLDKTTLHEMYSKLTTPSYMDSGSLNNLLAGQFCNASSAVTEIPVSGRSWSVFCKETTRGGGLIQVAYSYPTPNYVTTPDEDFYSAYRVKREGYTTWSRWYVTSSNQQEERERVKVVDRATHEVLPCVYNQVNKTLVQAAPYDYSYSTTTLGMNVINATTTPNTTTNLYSATLNIPAALVGVLRNTIFQGTSIQKFITNTNQIINLPSTWVTTNAPAYTPGDEYYTVTLNSEAALTNCTNIVMMNYTNKVLILGEVTDADSVAKTFTLTSNISLSLIGVGAYVKTQDGTANIGVVTSNKGGKITVEEVSGGFAAYNAGADGASKRTRLRISNPLTTYPEIQGSTLGTYTTPINTKILVKNQVYTLAHNGVYNLSTLGNIANKVPYVLTRSSDFDRGSLICGSSVRVVNGASGDTLFKNTLKNSNWTHYSTDVEYEENGVFKRGVLQNVSGSILLSNCFSVNNVTFKLTGAGLDNNTNKYYVSYVVKGTTTSYNRKSIDGSITSESPLTYPITLPTKIFYKVYDVTTNTALESLPGGATIDYVVYGYGV